jgi:hypothetical protein
MQRIVADTDALIAYARLGCWTAIRDNLGITTTTTCYRELNIHSKDTDSYNQKKKRKAKAAKNVLEALNDDDSTIEYEFCGSIQDEGEWSIVELVKQNTNAVEIILMMDSGDTEMAEGGRSYVRTRLNLKQIGVGMPSLGVPIGVLAQQKILSEDEACANINQISEREGWTSRNALKRIWEGVPLDCDQEPDFLG